MSFWQFVNFDKDWIHTGGVAHREWKVAIAIEPQTNEIGRETKRVENRNSVFYGYNIVPYATDPNHERAVAGILKKIGTFDTAEEIDDYIKRMAPTSPITAEMVLNTSEKYGAPAELLVAIMEQDSALGTRGIGARTFNPGNVGTFDSVRIRSYSGWQEGVDAVGEWLSRHKKL